MSFHSLIHQESICAKFPENQKCNICRYINGQLH